MSSYNASSDYCVEIISPVSRPIGANMVIPLYVNDSMFIAFTNYCLLLTELGEEAIYNRPMVWVGVFILIASTLCWFSMLVDLWSGFYNKRNWFPCRYFDVGAISLFIAQFGVKLATDMTSPMKGKVDITAKFGSLAFMCTILANIMPSLASKGNNKLLSSVIGISTLVIIIIGNTWVECHTGLIKNYGYFFVGCLLLQIIVLVSYAIMVASSKKILESKYQVLNKTLLNDQVQDTTLFCFKNLSNLVERYLVMAETINPQFALASNPICFFSVLISLGSLGFYIYVVVIVFTGMPDDPLQKSVYEWTMLPILITQFSGSVIGVIAPIIRWLTVVRYKSFGSENWKHVEEVFRVETYWTHKLLEWKETPVTIRIRSRRLRRFIRKVKTIALTLWIGFHKGVVVTSKMMEFFPIMVLSVIMVQFTSSSCNIDTNEEMYRYALCLDEKRVINEKALKQISDCAGPLIQKGKERQSKNLLKLLEKSVGFEGVEKFNLFQIEPLLTAEIPNSWSLAVASLACIAISLPSIDKDIKENLFESVDQGLFYTYLVEEGLCSMSSKVVNIQSAARMLWEELDESCKWMEENAYQGKTAMEILQWFSAKAQEILKEESTDMNNLPWEFVVMNSMYKITQSIIILTNQEEGEITEDQLFTLLCRMIADILLACYTNIPRLIIVKCYESAQENRKASVEAAAKLLGETKNIVSLLQNRKLPSMDPHERPFIDQWRLHF